MQTHSKSGITRKRFHPSLLLTNIKPCNAFQALKDANWATAMKQEYEALVNNHTWDLVSLPPARKVVGCKWLFRVKENPDGTVNKYMARLVTKGFNQIQGFDFHETFSPVIKLITIRIILTIALTNGWDLFHLDVNNAFLNISLDETIYMTQPSRFEVTDKNLVYKLNKSIYGLKQTPRQWFDKLKTTLLQLGFCLSKVDPSLFVYQHNHQIVYILAYIDDIIITGTSLSIVQQISSSLNSTFSLKQLGD